MVSYLREFQRRSNITVHFGVNVTKIERRRRHQPFILRTSSDRLYRCRWEKTQHASPVAVQSSYFTSYSRSPSLRHIPVGCSCSVFTPHTTCSIIFQHLPALMCPLAFNWGPYMIWYVNVVVTWSKHSSIVTSWAGGSWVSKRGAFPLSVKSRTRSAYNFRTITGIVRMSRWYSRTALN